MTARILLAALIGSAARDAETLPDLAHTLAAALKARGWALVPATLDDAMRFAIWRAQGEHQRLTGMGQGGVDPDASARAHVADPIQRQRDQAAWDAAIAEAATRDG
jgi:hypothetical protein